MVALTRSLFSASALIAFGLLGCQEADGSDGQGGALTTAEAGVPAPTLAQPIAPPEPQEVDVSALGHARGSEQAPIQVIEFTDFGCGYCRKFHDETWPVLLKDYVDAGKIHWRTVQFNVGMFKNSQEAALAGECAFQQNQWDEMRAALFRIQSDWKKANAEEALTLFAQAARDVGLDADGFEQCMTARDVEEPILVANGLAQQLGVRGTPTFYVNGYPVSGAAPIEVFREFFDKVLADMRDATAS